MLRMNCLSLPLLCVLVALPACAPSPRAAVEFGKTTEQQLKRQIGEPLKQHQPAGRPQATVLEYPEDSRYQIEGGLVVARFRMPERHEATLQYWKHQWKGLPKTYLPLTEGSTPHGASSGDHELRAPSLGLSVIYRPSIDRVIRVVEYVAR